MTSELEGRFLGVPPINVSQKDFDALREFVKSSRASDWIKFDRMKSLVDGWCVLCGGIPIRIASYDYNSGRHGTG